MTAPRRWKVAATAGGIVAVVLLAAAIAAIFWYRTTERTYYGAHTDLLHSGEHVVFSENFRREGDHVVAKASAAVVREESAWDEDSCDPDRAIKIALTSGEVISVPRHVLHRE